MPEGFLNFAIPQASNYIANNALNFGANGLMANLPTLAGTAGNSLLSNLATGIGSEAGNTALQNGIFSFLDMPQLAGNSGFLNSLTNTLGSDAFKNSVNAGSGLFSGLTSYNNSKDASKIAKENQAMYKDAYNRDVAADEKRQLLNF